MILHMSNIIIDGLLQFFGGGGADISGRIADCSKPDLPSVHILTTRFFPLYARLVPYLLQVGIAPGPLKVTNDYHRHKLTVDSRVYPKKNSTSCAVLPIIFSYQE